jgi:hypothetical protein
MNNRRRDLDQGYQHEGALRQPRMWDLQPRLADLRVAQEQDVQIQRSRPVADALPPVAPKLLFDFQQPFQQLSRLQVRFQLHHRINESRLFGKPHWLGAVER